MTVGKKGNTYLCLSAHSFSVSTMKRRLSTAALAPLDWLKYHPYSRFDPYDGFFLKSANRLFEYLNVPDGWFRAVFQREHLKELAIVLTCHFEDFINDIGLWKAFVRGNRKLYGRTLPFYDLEDYDPEYLTPQDFAYLAWHFLSQAAHKSLSPEADPIRLLAQYCYDLFEVQIEEAPDKSDFYRKWLTIEDQTPFFEVKARLDWMAFHNYLVAPEFDRQIKAEITEALQERRSFWREIDPAKLLYMMQDDFFYKRSSTWLAYTTPEWLAEVAHCSDQLRIAIRRLFERVTGNFLYEGADEGYYHFRFVRTNRVFYVHRKSVDLHAGQMRTGLLGVFNLVNWCGDWWLSGTYMGGITPSKQELAEMRISPEGAIFYGWTEAEQHKLREITAEAEATFLEFFGDRLVLFANEQEMKAALEAQQLYHNDRRAGTSTPEAEARMARYAAILENNRTVLGKGPFFEENQRIAVFFEPGEGVLMSPMLMDICRLLQKDDISKREADELFYTFFRDCSPAQVRHLLRKYSARNLRYPLGNLDVEAHLEFWMRFYNPGDFRETLPNTTLLPEE